MCIYLYVAQHNQTGLKYFGKTVIDPFPRNYLGGGTYWLRHLKKHGRDVSFTVIAEFSNVAEASAFALKFSIDNDIVKSSDWANLIPENALDGGSQKGRVLSEETKQKISEANRGRKTREYGPVSAETKQKMSASNKETWAKIDKRWVTDGTTNRRVALDQIPKGWRLGRTLGRQ